MASIPYSLASKGLSNFTKIIPFRSQSSSIFSRASTTLLDLASSLSSEIVFVLIYYAHAFLCSTVGQRARSFENITNREREGPQFPSRLPEFADPREWSRDFCEGPLFQATCLNLRTLASDHVTKIVSFVEILAESRILTRSLTIIFKFQESENKVERRKWNTKSDFLWKWIKIQ